MVEGRQFLALSLQQSSLLYLNQSMISLCLAAPGAIQRRSLDEIAKGQVRRGQIWRRSLDEVCGLHPAGCLAGPVYIHPGIQGGPGQIDVMHSDWPTILDAVGAKRSEDAPLGYSCLTCWFQADFLEAGNSHWPLTSAGSPRWIPRELNFYLLVTQAGSLSQPRRMLDFHCWKTQAASPYADKAVTSSEACERGRVAAYSLDLPKVQGRSGHHGIEWEEERGQEPNSDTFPKAAGHITPS